MRTAKALCIGLCLLCALAGRPALAISGNEQVNLAGAGRFDQLADALEQMVGREPLKVADWHALCYAYSRIKRYTKILSCLDRLEEALKGRDKRTRLFGLDDATPTVHLMRADALIELSDYPGALAQADKAIAWYEEEQSDDKDILINALAAKALANIQLGQRTDAERLEIQLENLPLGLMGGDYVGAKSLAMARVSMALGRWQKVIDALAQDRNFGLRVFLDNLASGAFLRGVNNWVWIELPRGFMQAKALLELGRRGEAKSSFDRLLAIPEVAANGEIHWLILHDRGRIAEEEGQLEQAEQFYLRAAEVVERQRATINTEANKIGFVGDKQSIYTRLVRVEFQLGKVAEAFESIERGKARALVDLLAARQSFATARGTGAEAQKVQAVLDKMSEEDQEARGQRESTIARTVERSRTPASASGPRDARQLAKELPAALASLVSVSGVDIKEVQGLLDKEESLLIYYGDLEQMYAVVVRKATVNGARIDSRTLSTDLRQLRKNLQDDEVSVDAQLQALYTTLVAPVSGFLQGDRLSIVPHSLLHYLPFAALNDGRQALVDRFSIRMLPSASVIKYLRPSRATASAGMERMLILGNPDLNDPKLDLPGSQVEAEKLAARFSAKNLLLRGKASRLAFQTQAPAAAYIHIASHGKFNSARPLQSRLLLAPEGGVDGNLTVSDLYNVNLDAELVTLSACETGLGAVANGDDVVGLTRGFLYAGASTVVASLWQVDDEATAFLMLSMYERLRRGDRRNALRQAQIETRAKFPHPYFWASFYLTGVN